MAREGTGENRIERHRHNAQARSQMQAAPKGPMEENFVETTETVDGSAQSRFDATLCLDPPNALGQLHARYNDGDEVHPKSACLLQRSLATR